MPHASVLRTGTGAEVGLEEVGVLVQVCGMETASP